MPAGLAAFRLLNTCSLLLARSFTAPRKDKSERRAILASKRSGPGWRGSRRVGILRRSQAPRPTRPICRRNLCEDWLTACRFITLFGEEFLTTDDPYGDDPIALRRAFALELRYTFDRNAELLERLRRGEVHLIAPEEEARRVLAAVAVLRGDGNTTLADRLLAAWLDLSQALTALASDETPLEVETVEQERRIIRAVVDQSDRLHAAEEQFERVISEVMAWLLGSPGGSPPQAA